MNRRALLRRMAAAVAASPALLTGPAPQVVKRIIESPPRFIFDPERRVMTERMSDGVYRVMTELVHR